jgi:DNA-directed RNA polymerase sigma subunit (sigma70/sigma32)
MPVAQRIARAWGNTTYSREEAEGDCFLRLVEIIDSSPDVKLTEPYVAESLRNNLRSQRSAKQDDSTIPDDKLISLDETLETEDGSVSLHELIADPNAVNAEAEMISIEEEKASEELACVIAELLRKLSATQRKTINLAYGLGGFTAITMTDVAKCLSVSRVTAYKYLNAAIEILRAELIALGYVVPPAGKFDVREMILPRAA